MSSLLDVCPRGAWITEEHAIQFLGLSSKSALKEAFRDGSLPHVFVDHGKQVDDVPQPFNKHRFFFVQKEGTTVSRPSINFASWVGICESLDGGAADSLNPAAQARIRDYTNYTDVEDAYRDLKSACGIVSSSELSGVEDGDDGYRYGSNGGTVRAPSKAASFSSIKSDGEIYTRADGKRVRRVKKSKSSSNGSSSKGSSLSGFLDQDEKSSPRSRMSGSRSVGAGEGEIHTRADGKKGEYCTKNR